MLGKLTAAVGIGLVALAVGVGSVAAASDPGACTGKTRRVCLKVAAELAVRAKAQVSVRTPEGVISKCASESGTALRWRCIWIVNNRPELAGRASAVFSEHRKAGGGTYWRTSVAMQTRCTMLTGIPTRWSYTSFAAAFVSAGCP